MTYTGLGILVEVIIRNGVNYPGLLKITLRFSRIVRNQLYWYACMFAAIASLVNEFTIVLDKSCNIVDICMFIQTNKLHALQYPNNGFTSETYLFLFCS